MNIYTRNLACILTLAALVCAACAPSTISQVDQPTATARTVAASPSDTVPAPSAAAATGYPPPKQTAKAVEATETNAREMAQATADAVGRDKPILATHMMHYANRALGLSFAYPSELGEVEFAVRGSGDTVESWNLGFSRFNALRLAGVSADFDEARGGMVEDTSGYVRNKDGSVRWLYGTPGSDGVEITVDEVITSGSGVQMVLFALPSMTGPDGDIPTTGPPAALVNLAGEYFPGFIVLNNDPARLPAETLWAILQTIEVTVPPQPDAGTSPPPGG